MLSQYSHEINVSQCLCFHYVFEHVPRAIIRQRNKQVANLELVGPSVHELFQYLAHHRKLRNYQDCLQYCCILQYLYHTSGIHSLCDFGSPNRYTAVNLTHFQISTHVIHFTALQLTILSPLYLDLLAKYSQLKLYVCLGVLLCHMGRGLYYYAGSR